MAGDAAANHTGANECKVTIAAAGMGPKEKSDE